MNFEYRLRPNLSVGAYGGNLLNVRSGYFQKRPDSPADVTG
jgi:hypothetical protein